jgi:uncharacterized protein
MRKIVISMILLYRVTLGRLLGGQCRFTPTCSQYAIDAVTRYGVFKGIAKAIWRVCRCHPLGGRGYDPA